MRGIGVRAGDFGECQVFGVAFPGAGATLGVETMESPAQSGKDLTTQQAADLLNVSREYLVRLLAENRIPFRKTGRHRRLRVEDVLAYKEQRDRDRAAGLRETHETLAGLPMTYASKTATEVAYRQRRLALAERDRIVMTAL